jgi:hypothetical protein
MRAEPRSRSIVWNEGFTMSRRTIRGTLGGLAAGLLLAAPADAGFTGGLTDPSCSPSGKRIVFTDLKQGGDREIVTIRPNGKDLKRLTKNDASDVDPAWTPNGKRILSRATAMASTTSTR